MRVPRVRHRGIIPVRFRPHTHAGPAMQLGLFSISYGGLWGQAALDVRAFVRRAADLGYDAVMLAGKRPHLSPLDFDPAAVAALRDDLEAAKVTCAAVAAYTDL